MQEYKKRIADALLAEKLAGKGAVLIEGPKWCGKTTTAEQQAKSILYMDDPQRGATNRVLADANPQLLLEGKTPRLIDEWQIAPKLWDVIRFEVDHRREFSQFILTGSAVPPSTEEIHHTGTGRFSWLRMRPMSLMESGESNASIGLGSLFESPETIYAENKLNLNDICFLICRGGWPLSTYLDGKLALNQARDYFDAVVNSDISRADNIRRDPQRTKRLMRSFARHQGQQVGNATICKDIKINDVESISPDTVHSYIGALKKIFVIEDAPSWNPNLRSKTAIRTSDTRYFVDPSIAAASLGFGPGDLVSDMETCGLMFETMAIRDLRIYAEALDGAVYHYRDKTGLECDAVVHLRNGSYGLIEIKIGGEKLIDQGATSLKKLANIIDTEKMKNPSFLMILTATSEIAYRRPDGVYVVPIGCLGV
ncbi:MAG: DUF4143 domain-containing protein [Spirochaetia bacterium]|jgi:predicted AAA+ superfamily ATPase|nr:DUF4143 domain-containing protein [Spirochaetia bacterium]